MKELKKRLRKNRALIWICKKNMKKSIKNLVLMNKSHLDRLKMKMNMKPMTKINNSILIK